MCSQTHTELVDDNLEKILKTNSLNLTEVSKEIMPQIIFSGNTNDKNNFDNTALGYNLEFLE